MAKVKEVKNNDEVESSTSEVKEKEVRKLVKKEFSLETFKQSFGLDETVKDKEISFYELSPAFKEATGIPGFPRGYVSAARGFSDTGKSTSIYESAVSAQKMGDLVVIMDLENNVDFQHLKKMGFEYEEVVDETTGEIVNYKGFFIYIDSNFLLNNYGKKKEKERREPSIEDSARFIHDMLEKQERGELPYNLLFLYDSIGVLNCAQVIKSQEEESNNNNMWNAGSTEVQFKGIWNHQIPMSRKENRKYINTFIAAQRIWEKSVGGKPVIENKGGKALYSACRLMIHFGGVMSHGIQKLYATKDGKKVHMGNITKVGVVKNQIGGGYGGISLEGDLISTPHGFIPNTPDAIKNYKKEHLDYFNDLLGNENLTEDFDVVSEFVKVEKDLE